MSNGVKGEGRKGIKRKGHRNSARVSIWRSTYARVVWYAGSLGSREPLMW